MSEPRRGRGRPYQYGEPVKRRIVLLPKSLTERLTAIVSERRADGWRGNVNRLIVETLLGVFPQDE